MFDVTIRGGTLGEYGKFKVSAQVEEKELKGFLSLVLKGEEQITVEDGYDFQKRVYHYVIQMGTYGENFRGLVWIENEDKATFLKVRDDVMSFHNRPLYGWENE